MVEKLFPKWCRDWIREKETRSTKRRVESIPVTWIAEDTKYAKVIFVFRSGYTQKNSISCQKRKSFDIAMDKREIAKFL